MFLRLLNEWGGEGKLSPRDIATKVKRFHHFYRMWSLPIFDVQTG